MLIMPPVGSQPSLTENSTININPIQNVGVAYDSSATTAMAPSAGRLTCRAAVTPRTTPIATAMEMLAPISSNVAGSRSLMSCTTVMLWRNENPRSRFTTFQT